MPKPKPEPAAKPKRKPAVKKNLKADERPGRGRPSKYTPEVVERICYSLSQGNTRTTAVTCAGVSMPTFHTWMNEFPDFSDAIKRAEEQAVEHYVNVIHTASTQTWHLRREVGEGHRRGRCVLPVVAQLQSHQCSGTIIREQQARGRRRPRTVPRTRSGD
jgi:hypothetical protein